MQKGYSVPPRYKTFDDYNLPIGVPERLYKRCLDPYDGDIDLLNEIALAVCGKVLAESIVASLTQGISYDRLVCSMYIPMNRGDWYGYRRKTLAEFYQALKRADRWIIPLEEMEGHNENQKDETGGHDRDKSL